MKTQFKFLLSAVLFLLAGTLAFAQSDAEEVPGDNFSLEGALELFKKSASPQEFERLLNSPDSKVNNLDLNGDGEIDYIRVVDKNEGNVHAFILSAAISAKESQDIAVIELEKRNDGTAVLQIVGDADIYGIETIIEPTEEVRVNAGTSTRRTVVNVWAWPSVQYVYGPAYSVWASPWYWGYYPGWYRPWRPVVWSVYNPYWAPYRPYYSVCYRHRIGYASMIYRPYRSTSVIVYNRNRTQISNFRNSSRGYRYDRGDNHTYGSGRYNRYDAEHGRRNNNNSYSNTGRSNGRSTSGVNSDVRSRNNNSRTYTAPAQKSTSDVNTNRSTRTRTFDRSTSGGSSDRSTSLNRNSRQYNPPTRQSAPTRQYNPSRSSGGGSPAFRSAPQQRQRTVSPSPSRSGGGSSGGHPQRRH